jgi:hypothetical protein
MLRNFKAELLNNKGFYAVKQDETDMKDVRTVHKIIKFLPITKYILNFLKYIWHSLRIFWNAELPQNTASILNVNITVISHVFKLTRYWDKTQKGNGS